MRKRVYFARFTSHPRDDIRRNWSAWMGSWKRTYADVVNWVVFDEARLGDDFPIDAAWRKWQRLVGRTVVPYDRDIDLPDAFLEWLGKEEGLDIRRDRASGRYAYVHHDHLSALKLDATDPIDAIKEAAQLPPDAYRGHAEMMIGDVEHIAEARPGLHVFAADRAELEPDL